MNDEVDINDRETAEGTGLATTLFVLLIVVAIIATILLNLHTNAGAEGGPDFGPDPGSAEDCASTEPTGPCLDIPVYCMAEGCPYPEEWATSTTTTVPVDIGTALTEERTPSATVPSPAPQQSYGPAPRAIVFTG